MTVYSAAIAASADDAHEADDGTLFNAAATNVRMEDSTVASARFNGGLRFPSTGIPQGSTINVGTFVTWTRTTAAFDSPDATLYCEAHDNAPDYSAGGNADVTSRVTTAGSVAYVASNLGAGAINTPDLATPVQEVVNRAGFGGTVNFLFKGNNNAAGEGWRMICFDSSPNTSRATVTIDYTAPAGGGVLTQRTLVGVGL